MRRSALAAAAMLFFALGVPFELQRANRIVIEETLERVKEIQYGER